MRTELISIPTPTHPLDGAYYTPDGAIKSAAMYCHGNQMNFYVCAARFLAPFVTSLGYAFLAFNRRGHDSVSTFDSREPVGGAYQTVAEGIEDNELAAQFLANQGFNNPVVIGHSNGGVLASEHVARHPETPALILLSAHAGGNRLTNPRSARSFTITDKTDEQTKEAEEQHNADPRLDRPGLLAAAEQLSEEEQRGMEQRHPAQRQQDQRHRGDPVVDAGGRGVARDDVVLAHECFPPASSSPSGLVPATGARSSPAA